MKRVNLVAVLSPEGDRVLMCKRRKDPYKGLYNFVGGKCREGEKGIDAAYRELWEETAITREDIHLQHIMDMTYYFADEVIEVYYGRLKQWVQVEGTENQLVWLNRGQDYFDCALFAGKGNLGHIMAMIEECEVLNNEGNKAN